MLIENQKLVFDKIRIGYNPLKKQKLLKNVYVKSQNQNRNITCYRCNKIGHKFIEYKSLNTNKQKIK